MSRPEFLNCAMPPEIIRHIRAEQDYYDQNPERYERQQREREEMRQEEEEQERYYRSIEEQREADLDNYTPPEHPVENNEDIKIEDLPF